MNPSSITAKPVPSALRYIKVLRRAITRAQYQVGGGVCGTSVAMIEKHYGRYIKSDLEDQLRKLFGRETENLTAT